MTSIWRGTGELTAALCLSVRSTETAEGFFAFFSGFHSLERDKMVRTGLSLHGPAVRGMFLESSLPKEGVLAPYWLVLKMILFFALVVSLHLSPLIPEVSCFFRDKGVTKNGKETVW